MTEFKIKKLLILIAVIGLLFTGQNYANADILETIQEGHGATAKKAFGNIDLLHKNPVALRGEYLKIFLSFLGVIFLILIIYGGYLWMWSKGNEEEVKKGKQTMVDASIGLAVVLAAYVIASYVIGKLVETAVL